jgi:membrane associated rhomboid family serine protease
MSANLYGVAVIVVIVAFLVFHLLSLGMPKIDETTAQKMLVPLIGLDGVLFGFTGVMAGLFMHNINRVAEKTLKRSLRLVLIAFWFFVFSFLFSFLLLGLGQDVMQMSVFTPIFATALGAVCSSIYLVLVFVDEYYPPKAIAGQ